METYTRIIEPATEPITTAEAKDHMRITHTDEDTYIAGLIAVARMYIEDISYRALVTQTWQYSIPCFPAIKEIELPVPPLQSITLIEYLDEVGVSTTFNASNYIVDTAGLRGRVVLADSANWPSPSSLYPVNPVRITFVAGYTAIQDIDKQLMYFLVAHWYENREPTISGTFARSVPTTLEQLISMRLIY